MILEELGLDDWFKEKIDKNKAERFKIARVTAVNRDSYIIRNETGEAAAELSGRIIYSSDSPSDYPAVGDWVCTQYLDNNTFAVIHEILPRKSMLQRKTSGKKIDYQLIAANIDTAFIMQSLDADYNLRRLERYMIMVNESHIHPVVLLSKSDLVSADQLESKTAQIRTMMTDTEIVPFSNLSAISLNTVKGVLKPGKTYCLLGSSGVGKTTLLNNLLGNATFPVQEVRKKDSRGKHTTTRRQLITLQNGAMIIDTPGMRELGNISVDSGLSDTFSEITTIAAACQYSDCTHMHEDGCAVIAALKEGVIDAGRFQSYLKLSNESVFNQMSYIEKRRKDRNFGKMVNTVKKQLGLRKRR